MKAKPIAAHVLKQMDRMKTKNVSVHLGKLRPEVLQALRENYGFKEVRPEFMGYVYFQINS